MHEDELGLALDRGVALRAHELLGDEVVEALEDVGDSCGTHGRDRPGPEAAPDHGGVGEQRLALRAEQVEARGDQRADRVGQRQFGARLERDLAAAASRAGRGPRAAAPAPRRRAGCRRRRSRSSACRRAGSDLAPRRARTSCAVSSPESGPSAMCAAAATKPAPGPATSVTSGRAVASTSSGTPRGALRQVVHEGEHRLVGPVQVLDDEHRGPRGGEALEELAPGGEVLLAGRLVRLEAEQRPQAGAQAGRGREPSGRTASRRASVRADAVALEDAGRVAARSRRAPRR